MITVTLTTDWGNDGLYAGAFKGKLVSRIPGVQLVDVSHTIEPLQPFKAMLVLRHAYSFFMKKTIHIVSVGGSMLIDKNADNRQFICFEHDYYYFIGPNNGMWESLLGSMPREVYALPHDALSSSFSELDVYIDTVGKLALGMLPKHLGEQVNCNAGQKINLPVRRPNTLLGEFLYFDIYGNGITNITKTEFEEMARNKVFSISAGSNHAQYKTNEITENYKTNDPTKIMALFSFTGYLEIAVPNRQLTQFLHIDKNTKILVRFYESEQEMEEDDFNI